MFMSPWLAEPTPNQLPFQELVAGRVPSRMRHQMNRPKRARPPINESGWITAPTAEAAATTATGAATRRAPAQRTAGWPWVRPSVNRPPLRQPRFRAWIRQAAHWKLPAQTDETQTNHFFVIHLKATL
jgi:hypothetical protein